MDNCFTGRRDWSHQMSEKDFRTGHSVHSLGAASYFLSRQRDVVASFSFGAWSVQKCFLQRNVLKFNYKFIHFISRILDSSYVLGSDCYLKNAILSSKS